MAPTIQASSPKLIVSWSTVNKPLKSGNEVLDHDFIKNHIADVSPKRLKNGVHSFALGTKRFHTAAKRIATTRHISGSRYLMLMAYWVKSFI
jgi:hypothetical protein